MVDLAESPAERDLRLRIEIQAGKHQYAVALEGVEHRFTQRVIGSQPSRVDTDDLGTDRCRSSFVDGSRTWLHHGSGSPMRSRTASAESVGFGWPKISIAIETMTSE